MGLIDRCKEVMPRNATEDEILKKHTKEHYDLLKSTSQYPDEDVDKIEELCSNYDTVFIHPVSRVIFFLYDLLKNKFCFTVNLDHF